MLNIAITFDYELFFGDHFVGADEMLFSPTEQLLKILNKYSISATFFVDVLSVYMHEKAGEISYCQKFIQQIQKMLQAGHDVQLHIHSHWLTSGYENGKWIFDETNYRIHSFGFDETKEMSVYGIIKWGKDFLENNLKKIDENYACVAFRAGGFCVQPHEGLFQALNKNGIWIDSSVAVQQQKDGINKYDYTNIPPERNGWWIKSTGSINEQVSSDEGDIFEVPIICTSRSLIRRLLHPEAEKTLRCGKPKGTYIGQSKCVPVQNITLRKMKALLNYNRAKPMLTCDSLRYGAILRELFKRAKCAKKEEYISIIGHPKLIDNIWLANFEEILRGISINQNCRIVTMTEMGSQLR